MPANVQEAARAAERIFTPDAVLSSGRSRWPSNSGVPAEDLAVVIDDVVHLVRCLVALDDHDSPDRWRREAQSYEALARARRSLHRCARNRGMI